MQTRQPTKRMPNWSGAKTLSQQLIGAHEYSTREFKVGVPLSSLDKVTGDSDIKGFWDPKIRGLYRLEIGDL